MTRLDIELVNRQICETKQSTNENQKFKCTSK